MRKSLAALAVATMLALGTSPAAASSPLPAPPHSLFHSPWWKAHIANSDEGAVLARRAGDHWIDNDFHLSSDGVWINGHGAPELFWLARGDKFEHHPAAQLFGRARMYDGRYQHLRNAHQALLANAHHGLGTEFEVKDVRPRNTPEILDAAFARLAAHAQDAYGDAWQHHLLVKVLTNLAGGEAYALQICAAAHAHGIPTMLLARGAARFHHYYGHTDITWVRNSAVIR